MVFQLISIKSISLSVSFSVLLASATQLSKTMLKTKTPYRTHQKMKTNILFTLTIIAIMFLFTKLALDINENSKLYDSTILQLTKIINTQNSFNIQLTKIDKKLDSITIFPEYDAWGIPQKPIKTKSKGPTRPRNILNRPLP